MSAIPEQADIVIVGGGMVGLTLAALLAPQGLKIVVLDKKFVKTLSPTPTLRVSAINLASRQLLEHLGIWQGIPPDKIAAYTRMHVWEGAAALDFSAREAGVEQLGFIVENEAIQVCLYEHLAACDNVTLQESEVNAVQKMPDGYALTFAGGQYACRLLVAADGRNSSICTTLNVPIYEKPYGQAALVCRVTTEKPHAQTASQIFLPTGPLAFLPLAEAHTASIVWTLPEEEAATWQQADKGAFETRLMEASQGVFGNIALVGIRQSFLLWQRHAGQYVDDHLAFVGDAAHAIHPLAGLGANLGLNDVTVLAAVIIDARERHRPWFSRETLKAYELACRGHNQKIQEFCRLINALFLSPSKNVGWLRQTGLLLFNKSSRLKQYAMRQALGIE